ncbi:uncharacterized protein BP5553_09261 [Venustampulla echinocandica]|uniref:Uncharacterized protein n=1 Tax=Venustampulla echinocandica TaxID=2656787 RepID=A0A370TC75_9HELO|nr:uncharacterized protein BP5553_09261 [Venustampulla echinocandica]RDL31859.1 hypothetical protein BP5553_09261 [Venustampulla echinocandica]
MTTTLESDKAEKHASPMPTSQAPRPPYPPQNHQQGAAVETTKSKKHTRTITTSQASQPPCTSPRNHQRRLTQESQDSSQLSAKPALKPSQLWMTLGKNMPIPDERMVDAALPRWTSSTAR